MFATKPKLFSIGTIVVPTLVCSNQLVKLITLVGFNLVEQVIVHVELVSKHLFCLIYMSNCYLHYLFR